MPFLKIKRSTIKKIQKNNYIGLYQKTAFGINFGPPKTHESEIGMIFFFFLTFALKFALELKSPSEKSNQYTNHMSGLNPTSRVLIYPIFQLLEFKDS